MYVVQIFQDPDWVIGSSHTELADAQAQKAIFIESNDIDEENVKLGVQDAEGNVTDYEG